MCEPVTGPDGTTQQTCHEIGDFGKSTLVQTSEEPASDNCAGGGKRIDTGFDDNDNGILDRTEIDVSAHICDGANGADGATRPTGLSALTAMSPVDPGADCESGGLCIDYGVGTDGSGTLEAGEQLRLVTIGGEDLVDRAWTAGDMIQVSFGSWESRAYAPLAYDPEQSL